MSTPATIIIKIRPEDIGKYRKCDTTKIHLRTNADVLEREISFHPDCTEDEIVNYASYSLKYDPIISPEELSKRVRKVKLPRYLEIYHHLDGYPSGLGKELKRNYKTYEDVLNLVLAGGFSTILEGSMPYMRRKDAQWKFEKPQKSNELTACTMYYQYYFDGETWYWRENGKDKFKKL